MITKIHHYTSFFINNDRLKHVSFDQNGRKLNTIPAEQPNRSRIWDISYANLSTKVRNFGNLRVDCWKIYNFDGFVGRFDDVFADSLEHLWPSSRFPGTLQQLCTFLLAILCMTEDSHCFLIFGAIFTELTPIPPRLRAPALLIRVHSSPTVDIN